jgi:hypothetical protein
MNILKILHPAAEIRINNKLTDYENAVKFINKGLTQGINEINLAKVIFINNIRVWNLLRS